MASRVLVAFGNPPDVRVVADNEEVRDEVRAVVEQDEDEDSADERVKAVPDEAIYQNLVDVGTVVQVDELEAYIKQRDIISDGFVPEYNVSCILSSLGVFSFNVQVCLKCRIGKGKRKPGLCLSVHFGLANNVIRVFDVSFISKRLVN